MDEEETNAPVEEETNAPEIERWAKMKVAYHNLLLWAIHDVRMALSLGRPVIRAFKALLSILPPEIQPEIEEKYKTGMKRLDEAEERDYHLYRVYVWDNEGVFRDGYVKEKLTWSEANRIAQKWKKEIEKAKKELYSRFLTYYCGPKEKREKLAKERLSEWMAGVKIEIDEEAEEDDMVDKYEVEARYIRKRREFISYLLSEVIRLLDEHGMLREFRSEEVGGS